MQEITQVLGWCAGLGLGLLVLSSIFILVAGGWARRLHGRMFGLSDEDLARAYFQYLAQLKIAVLVLFLVPYVALRLSA